MSIFPLAYVITVLLVCFKCFYVIVKLWLSQGIKVTFHPQIAYIHYDFYIMILFYENVNAFKKRKCIKKN